jgi:hypothetical protein
LDHLDLSGLYYFVVGLHLSREAVAAVGWAWLRQIALFMRRCAFSSAQNSRCMRMIFSIW